MKPEVIPRMAISLRRAFLSCRELSLLLRTTTSASCREVSYLAASSPCIRGSSASPPIPATPAIDFLYEIRRGFAKGRKQIKYEEDDDSGSEGSAVGTNIRSSVKEAAVSQMEAAVEALSRELAKLRTGRAAAGMLDHIIVETSGVRMPLNRMAVVSVIDPKTLSVTPYDPNALKELEKAIISSPLGINPKADNQRLIAPIPPLTKEHMQAVCKVVAKSSEDVKQSIRRSRQKALDTMKKALPKKKDKDKTTSNFSEDDAKRLEKEIDEITKKFIKSAEDMCKAKEKEITSG